MRLGKKTLVSLSIAPDRSRKEHPVFCLTAVLSRIPEDLVMTVEQDEALAL